MPSNSFSRRRSSQDDEDSTRTTAEAELRTMKDELRHAQTELSKSEEERQRLREANITLEEEKRKIQRQLNDREKEVQSLVKRCRSQGKKMKERSMLRVSNKELETDLAKSEEERQRLSEANIRLEHDKQDIQCQLNIREKEVKSLVKRCWSQGEKMKERSSLRVFINELESEMEGLRTELEYRTGDFEQSTKCLKEFLAEKEAEVSLLTAELQKVRDAELSDIQQPAQSAKESDEASSKEQDSIIANLLDQLEKVQNEKESSLACLQEQLESVRTDLAQSQTVTEKKDKRMETVRSDLEESRRAADIDKQEYVKSLHKKDESIAALQSELAKVQLENRRCVRESNAPVDTERVAATDEVVSSLQIESDDAFTSLDNAIEEFREQAQVGDASLSAKLAGKGEERSQIDSLSSELTECQRLAHGHDSGTDEEVDMREAMWVTMQQGLEDRILNLEEVIATLWEASEMSKAMWVSMEQGFEKRILSLEAEIAELREEAKLRETAPRERKAELEQEVTLITGDLQYSNDILQQSASEIVTERSQEDGLSAKADSAADVNLTQRTRDQSESEKENPTHKNRLLRQEECMEPNSKGRMGLRERNMNIMG